MALLLIIYCVGESKNIIIQLTSNRTSYTAEQLIENMDYQFNVRARTDIGWGIPLEGNISIGWQPGAFTRNIISLLFDVLFYKNQFLLAYEGSVYLDLTTFYVLSTTIHL